LGKKGGKRSGLRKWERKKETVANMQVEVQGTKLQFSAKKIPSLIPPLSHSHFPQKSSPSGEVTLVEQLKLLNFACTPEKSRVNLTRQNRLFWREKHVRKIMNGE